MTTDSARFYGDLARWWPLISPVADYEEEAQFIAGLFRKSALDIRTVMELGSGGGNNAAHLQPEFAMTLVDLSPQMLEVSKRLNPGCAHVVGDMKTVRLGRSFDGVLIHDAIGYMRDRGSLTAALTTAFEHLVPGGRAVIVPDEVTETFEPGTEHGGSDADDGSGARYLEWSPPPTPGQLGVSTEYAFVLRSADGSIELVHETHHYGLFDEAVWLDAMRQCGFAATVVTEETDDDRVPRRIFIGDRPTR